MSHKIFKLFSLAVILVMAFGFVPMHSQPVIAGVPLDLFFSEYVEGTSYNKALEIYNPTDTAVDLAAGAYSIQQYSNGNSTASATIDLTGTLAAGDVFVLTQGSANDTIKAVADQIYGTTSFFNGDDAIVLRKGESFIDVIGQVGFDPGSEWGTGLVSTADNTIRRKATVCNGDPDGSNAFDPAIEWDGYAVDTFDGLGAHTSNCGSVETAPSVLSTTPIDGATGVSLSSNIVINFSEAVDVTASWFSISCATSGTHTAAVSGGPTDFTLDPDANFSIGEACTVTVLAANVSDQDTNDPPGNMATDFVFSFTTVNVLINELDSDTPGTDALEFIELYDGGIGNTPLDGLSIVFYNGNNDLSYYSIDLDSFSTDPNGYFLMGNPDVIPAPAITFIGNLLQNGQDAVALYLADATSFPLNTPVTTVNLIDAIVYDTSDADDTGLLVLLNPGEPQVDENSTASSATVSNQRCPNGSGGLRNTSTYTQANPTPGSQNCPPPPPEACGDPYTAIYEVQGNVPTSPLVGTEVSIEGVVVGDFQNNASPDNGDLNGFHVQDPTGDGDTLTSDGIFIYGSSALDVARGDAVRVRGTVSEYNGMTEINAAQIWLCSSGNGVNPTAVSLPASSTHGFEAYEGMLVTFPQPLVISEYFNFDRYNEIVLTSERHMTPTALYEPGSPEYYQAVEDFLLDKITLDDGRSVQNPDPAIHPNGNIFNMSNLFRGGDTVTNVTGVVDYSFDLYRIQPVQGANYTLVNTRPATPANVGGSLKVVSMNTLNYFVTTTNKGSICGPLADQDCRGADDAAELARQQAKLVAAIVAMDADVVGLIEIENSPDDRAMETLVGALNAATTPGMYVYVPTGAIGGDAIRVALIYKPASVSRYGDFAILDSSVDSRFIDTRNRPVLAQSFMAMNEGIFTVAVNHLKSKGSACSGDPDLSDGAGNCNLTRLDAVKAEVDWLATDPTGSGDPDVLIIGDLNSYAMEDPIDALKAGPDDVLGTADDYMDLAFEFNGDDAYSYVFDGQIGYLDYAASGPLTSQVTGTTIWHINADEPDLIDYDMSFKLPAQDLLYAPDQYRYADHDPLIIGLNLVHNVAPTVDAGGPYSVVEGQIVAVTATGSDEDGDVLTYSWDLDNNGTFETPGQVAFFDASLLTAPATVTIRVKATDPGGLSAEDTATVYIIYKFTGFQQPVDNLPVINTANAGSVIPVKFKLGGDKGLDIFADGFPLVEATSCSTYTVKDKIENTFAASFIKLVYDPIKRQYTFIWATEKAWAGTCQMLTIKFNDGTTHQAVFKFK